MFQFNNSVLSELNPVGQKNIKSLISEVIEVGGEIKLNDLSVGLEFTDKSTSHFYDSFTSLCRYTIFSHTQVGFNFVIAHKGEILKREFVSIDDLETSYQDLIKAYTQKSGLILMSRESKEWESKGQPASLESFVKKISADPLL